MEVLSMHHQVYSSLEGRTVHGELRITKYIDKASPKLAQVLINGEVLVEMVLRFYRPSPTGAYEHYYTIKLEDAIITSIETHAMDSGRHMEEVSFSYMLITWTDEVTGIEFIDDLGATT
jgi:type VI secretion system secreted protein Hcp